MMAMSMMRITKMEAVCMMPLRLLKSHARQTKYQIRIDYDWDGKEANFAYSVSSFVTEYLFPCLKFLKD
jgi:hypothetical protein